MLRYFVGWAFERHCSGLHGADFEVCKNPVCWLACVIEKLFYRVWYE